MIFFSLQISVGQIIEDDKDKKTKATKRMTGDEICKIFEIEKVE